MTRRATLVLIALVVGCEHSPALVSPVDVMPPATSGGEVRLTYNIQQDYWPIATEDGSGILYAYVDAGERTVSRLGHRCIGLMPSSGGTRFWEWCDQRVTSPDSVRSFPAFALGHDGRLLYVEAASAKLVPFAPQRRTLWLADSARPVVRRAVLSLPVTVSDSEVSWLADLAWTGPTTFIALAQRFQLASHLLTGEVDSSFAGEFVVRGAINGDATSLTAIPGTEGASSYSIADGGASIVFTRRDSLSIYRIPAAGGVATSLTVTSRADVQLLGISCRISACVVALGPVTLWRPGGGVARIGSGDFNLEHVDLTTGAVTPILTRKNVVVSCPVWTASGDIIAQVGNGFGHLQTFNSPESDLYLYPKLAP